MDIQDKKIILVISRSLQQVVPGHRDEFLHWVKSESPIATTALQMLTHYLTPNYIEDEHVTVCQKSGK